MKIWREISGNFRTHNPNPRGAKKPASCCQRSRS